MLRLRHVCGLALALMVGLGVVGCSKGLVGRPPDLTRLSTGGGGNPPPGNPGRAAHDSTPAAGGASAQDSSPLSAVTSTGATIQNSQTEIAAQNRVDVAVTQPLNATEQYALDSTDLDLLNQQGLLDSSEQAALGSFVRK